VYYKKFTKTINIDNTDYNKFSITNASNISVYINGILEKKDNIKYIDNVLTIDSELKNEDVIIIEYYTEEKTSLKIDETIKEFSFVYDENTGMSGHFFGIDEVKENDLILVFVNGVLLYKSYSVLTKDNKVQGVNIEGRLLQDDIIYIKCFIKGE
jgi:hypothetical protein